MNIQVYILDPLGIDTLDYFKLKKSLRTAKSDPEGDF
jgi:hypothetical protein